MFKKHKQLIIGFVLGALVFGIVPVSATVQEYVLQKSQAKVLVDGKEFSNSELPVLNYQGYNYIPAATFREITNTLGVGFEWVGDRNEIQITTVKADPAPTKSERVVERQVNRPSINQDGYTTIFIDGVEYISLKEIMKQHKEYEFRYSVDPMIAYLALNPSSSKSKSDHQVIVDNIPVTVVEGASSIQFNYFKQNILSLIK